MLKPTPTDPYERFLIRGFRYWELYLHQNQVYLGRCYLALRREDAEDPFIDCTVPEQGELGDILAFRLIPALERLFQLDKPNYANLRNVWPRCHWHVIPRYAIPRTFAGETFTDERWGHNWSPYDHDRKFSEELLFKIRDALRAEI